MKYDKETFIEKSKALYGEDAFDYSLVDYVNGYTDIILICKEHGQFGIQPSVHLKITCGCPECSKKYRKKRKTMTNDEYKRMVIEKQGNIYDLSKVMYNGMKEYVTATCPIHGDFSIVAYDFAHKRGCPKCGIDERSKARDYSATVKNGGGKRMDRETFIRRAREVHGDKYDYSKVEYVNSSTKVCIVCPEHGEFLQVPSSHLNGHGCKKCGKEQMGRTQSMTTDEFIRRAREVHGDKYDYSKTVYCGCYEKVEIICPTHGTFTQAAYSHLNGHGCKKCADESNVSLFLSNTEDFIQKAKNIHDENNDYSQVVYRGARIPVAITCENGHTYMQMPNKHLSGHGCPYCSNNVSRDETEIRKFIELLGFQTEVSNRKILNGAKEIDILVPAVKIAVEYDGLYWHNETRKNDKRFHLSKTEECAEQGIRLIHIFEDEWLERKEIVKSRLQSILGTTPRKVYARNCAIRIVDTDICRAFLETNHIQGSVNAPIRYGLYLNDELLSVMTFCRPRKNLGQDGGCDEYELLRFCNRLNTTVVGGASKLFKHFVREYNPSKIVSYADRRWNTGGVYEKMGFSFSHFSEPNYFYIIGQKRYNRFGFRKDVLVKQGFDPSKSEHEIMFERGIYRIYDCGTLVYEWVKET